jgi:DNA uptake protein ComE-like DNA-binding protein
MSINHHAHELDEIKALANEYAQSVQQVLEHVRETRNELALHQSLIGLGHDYRGEGKPAEEETEEVEAKQPPPAGDVVGLNSASFEQLRELGMSVTQARRVITYRDDRDGFDSVDGLDEIPGFPRAFLAQLKGKLTL